MNEPERYGEVDDDLRSAFVRAEVELGHRTG